MSSRSNPDLSNAVIILRMRTYKLCLISAIFLMRKRYLSIMQISVTPMPLVFSFKKEKVEALRIVSRLNC